MGFDWNQSQGAVGMGRKVETQTGGHGKTGRGTNRWGREER